MSVCSDEEITAEEIWLSDLKKSTGRVPGRAASTLLERPSRKDDENQDQAESLHNEQNAE